MKPTPSKKDGGPPSVTTNPGASSSMPKNGTPSVVTVGAIDWRFADPNAEGLVGLNFGRTPPSPLALNLISRLAVSHGLTESEGQNMLSAVPGIQQLAVSIRDNHVVCMVTGSVAVPTSVQPGWKAVPVSGNGILIGDIESVDQALQRFTTGFPSSDLTLAAGHLQANTDLWAVGSGRLLGTDSISTRVKRFSLAASLQDSFISDTTFEFSEEPDPSTLRKWPPAARDARIDGNIVRVRTSIDPDQVQQKFGDVTSSLAGQRLASLVSLMRYLPARNTAITQHTKPVIYGLDDGPKELGHGPQQ